MPTQLDFDTDGRDWPLREHSRFVVADGIRWHVQVSGPAEAPVVLLIHGTGAATHSWRGLAPLLAQRLRVVAMDLPGHGFTGMPLDWPLTLPRMAQAVATLASTMGLEPALLVGHSAGAPIALRMALDGLAAPRAVVSLNGALAPLEGLAGQVFSPMARLLAMNPLVPRLFAWRASNRRVVERLIGSTGSKIDAQGLAWYARLVASPGHAAGALAMMANWDLVPLQHDLRRLHLPLHLVVGSNDRTVPPSQSSRAKLRVPGSTLEVLPGLGHLAHEERPDLVAPLVLHALDTAPVAAPASRPRVRRHAAP